MKSIVKIVVLLSIAFGFSAISGCKKDVVYVDQLQFREEVAYIVNSNKPYSGGAVDAYENGQIGWEASYKKGRLAGKMNSYRQNGSLIYSYNFKAGEDKGNVEFTSYNPDGSVVETWTLKSGQLKAYDGKGSIILEAGTNGYQRTSGRTSFVFLGSYKSYHPNGKPHVITTYGDGNSVEGSYEEYDSAGTLLSKAEHKIGGNYIGKRETYWSDGKPHEIKNYNDSSRLDGVQESYNANGILVSRENYTNGSSVGKQEYFFETGKPRLTYTKNVNSSYEGEYVEYDETSGAVRLKKQYVNGQESGKTEYYYPNGKLERSYDNSTGSSEYFDSTGAPVVDQYSY